MTPNALFAGNPRDWPVYQTALPDAFARAGISVNLLAETDDPASVDYIIYAPSSAIQDFTPFTRLKAVLNLWAGVEGMRMNQTLKVPLTRMVETGMTAGMAEWVLGHVMRHHLGMDAHILGQDGAWRNEMTPPLAKQRVVGLLGLGALGSACGDLLNKVGFQVKGWSRRAKSLPGIECLSGEDGLESLLRSAEILILLVPLTGETENVLNAARLAMLPRGAVIINPGRGPLIDDTALLAALDSGQIGHATLDVFRVEPLPVDHAFWAHPHVTVTPHIASATRAQSASDTIAENIRRGEAGEPYLYLVDRLAGY
jgi:glyoxylate/hydroxypyruvate reductase